MVTQADRLKVNPRIARAAIGIRLGIQRVGSYLTSVRILDGCTLPELFPIFLDGRNRSSLPN
jgi:hypothetical protein